MEGIFKLGHVEPLIVDVCPACQGKRVITNFITGEVYCSECGMVIY